jgi:hypothetical protein
MFYRRPGVLAVVLFGSFRLPHRPPPPQASCCRRSGLLTGKGEGERRQIIRRARKPGHLYYIKYSLCKKHHGTNIPRFHI